MSWPGSDPLVETLGALRRTGGVERIELAGFEPAEVVSVMEAIAGQAMDDQGVALAHAIHRETDGNPFFVDEVLRHLFEVGALHLDEDGRWVVPAGVDDVGLPAGVREVIDARVVRLGRASAANLSLAAVIGRDFDLDLLLAAAETTADELLDILEEAATVALVREPADRPGWYSFSHALIQRTLYESAGASAGPSTTARSSTSCVSGARTGRIPTIGGRSQRVGPPPGGMRPTR